CARHVKNVTRFLSVVTRECKFKALRDVKREAIEKWLLTGANLKRSARTRNTYTGAMKAFMRWCIESDRVLVDPLACLHRADERSDRRRTARAFTPQELQRLLDAARRRPLEQGELHTRGWRRNQSGVKLRPQTRARLAQLGRERALTYKLMALTGLRLGEVA